MKKIVLFDIPICDATLQETVSLILKRLAGEDPTAIYFVNAHCVNVASRDPRYFHVLQKADYVFADGVGMKLAANILQKPLHDNVNGTDLYPLLLDALHPTGYRIFLLGGEPGVAEKMKQRALQSHPDLVFCGSHHGYFEEGENDGVIRIIQEAKTDLLLVALGVPQQELWLADHLQETKAKVGIGVGGLFNFYSGRIPRAPLWMRRTGLEWCHRLWMEPGRLWKRYLLGNVRFLSKTIVARFHLKKQ